MGFYGKIQAQDHDFKQVLRNTQTLTLKRIITVSIIKKNVSAVMGRQSIKNLFI